VTDRVQRVGRGDSGFSLIELMIALVVVSIGLLALSAVQTRSSNDVYSTGRQSGALALAQERIELARAAGFTAAVSDSGQTGPYLWTTHVNPAGLELNQVDVSVVWSEQGIARSLQLQTLLSLR
jgi:prepilin-type N-terminal cleavage/methylation domain-containing protein